MAACAIGLYVRAAQVPQHMEPDELSRTARKLESDALEAQALARALAVGQLTTHFAVSQHDQISDDLEDIRKALDRPPPAGREAQARRLGDAARRLGEVLKTVPQGMANAEAMARAAQDEAAIARDAASGGGS